MSSPDWFYMSDGTSQSMTCERSVIERAENRMSGSGEVSGHSRKRLSGADRERAKLAAQKPWSTSDINASHGFLSISWVSCMFYIVGLLHNAHMYVTQRKRICVCHSITNILASLQCSQFMEVLEYRTEPTFRYLFVGIQYFSIPYRYR